MSYVGDILREYEAGLIDWHSARDELCGFGIFDGDLIRAIGECPIEERRQYGEPVGEEGNLTG